MVARAMCLEDKAWAEKKMEASGHKMWLFYRKEDYHIKAKDKAETQKEYESGKLFQMAEPCGMWLHHLLWK